MAPAEPKVKKPKAPDVVSRQMTMHLARRVKNITFKKKAPRAIREIKKFAVREMKTRYDSCDTANILH
jgi:large subunit ribosomal protein L31e